MLSKVGFWAFIIGLILCVIGGFAWPSNNGIVIALLILGLIIGFLNVTAKETMLFLVATIALMVTGRVFEPLSVLSLGEHLDNVLSYVATLVAPAAIIAAIKALWTVGKPGESS
jgi:hypothetical protein